MFVQKLTIKKGKVTVGGFKLTRTAADTTTDWHSCFGGRWFKSHTRPWLFWPWVLIVFLSSFKKILKECF